MKGKDTPPWSTLLASCAVVESQNNGRITSGILWQLAKIRLEWISQSNESIGRPLGFVTDRLNTSASLYRIAPCLSRVM